MSEHIYTHKDEAVRLFFSQCKHALDMSEQLVKEYKPMLMNRRFVTDAQLSDKLNISRRTLQDTATKGGSRSTVLTARYSMTRTMLTNSCQTPTGPDLRTEHTITNDKGGSRVLTSVAAFVIFVARRIFNRDTPR